jgi:HEAT repeat protein
MLYFTRITNIPIILLVLGISGCVTVKEEPENPVAAWVLKLLPDSPQVRRQKLMERLGSADADQRRQGVLMLSEGDAPSWDATAKILRIMARGDVDGQVRAAAVHVLVKNYAIENIMDVLKDTAGDKIPLVRRETLEGVSRRQENDAMEILLVMLEKDEERAIRSRAAAVLAKYPHRKVVRSLVTGLEDSEFAVSYQARESLKKLTGKDFGYDVREWQSWLAATEDPFTALAGDYE